MKGRNTTVIGIRVPDALYERVKFLADKQGVTVSEWGKYALMRQASVLPNGSVRQHKKKGANKNG